MANLIRPPWSGQSAQPMAAPRRAIALGLNCAPSSVAASQTAATGAAGGGYNISQPTGSEHRRIGHPPAAGSRRQSLDPQL